jgi:hypothetical protein
MESAPSAGNGTAVPDNVEPGVESRERLYEIRPMELNHLDGRHLEPGMMFAPHSAKRPCVWPANASGIPSAVPFTVVVCPLVDWVVQRFQHRCRTKCQGRREAEGGGLLTRRGHSPIR